MTLDAPLQRALQLLAQGASLSREAAAEAFAVLMRGEGTPVQCAALLMGLRAKGETADELAGAAGALRSAMLAIAVDRRDQLVDTCGTGGGRVGTLNISTAAALVAAGAGIPVAKHGNRSYTSRSGSADVLEALGIDITLAPERAAQVLEHAGIVFLFAPLYHPAMRHLAPIRKELAVPTIMNLLGPLANPAGVGRQVIGVSDGDRAPLVAQALARLGARHALVLHGMVGMDEISPCGATRVWEVREREILTWELDPMRFGLHSDELSKLAGSGPAENAAAIERVLAGKSDGIVRSAVLLNTAAALYVSGNGWSIEESIARATDALDRGEGSRALARLRAASAAQYLRMTPTTTP